MTDPLLCLQGRIEQALSAGDPAAVTCAEAVAQARRVEAGLRPCEDDLDGWSTLGWYHFARFELTGDEGDRADALHMFLFCVLQGVDVVPTALAAGLGRVLDVA